MLQTILRSRVSTVGAQQLRFASVAAVKSATSSNTPLSAAYLGNIESRWEKMSEAERDEMTNALSERQKADWRTLTPLEKQASWYISYGSWGPRQPIHPKGEAGKIFFGVVLGVLAAAGVFTAIKLVLPGKPKTMSREWQTAANERLEKYNAEPFTGHDQRQSPYRGVFPTEDDDE